MENKFKNGDLVRHLKSGIIYIINDSPREFEKLEYCNESFYSYFKNDKNDNESLLWFRCKSEMEDGRFEKNHKKELNELK